MRIMDSESESAFIEALSPSVSCAATAVFLQKLHILSHDIAQPGLYWALTCQISGGN